MSTYQQCPECLAVNKGFTEIQIEFGGYGYQCNNCQDILHNEPKKVKADMTKWECPYCKKVEVITPFQGIKTCTNCHKTYIGVKTYEKN